MALFNMKLSLVALAVLVWTPSECRNYTNEDIRDALISVVHLLRLSEDKLERHEFREKALGEHVKKMLNGLDKKHRALEPIKGMISRMDDRLSNVETVLMQKATEEKSTQKKTNEALDNIQKSLHDLTATVKSLVPSKPTEIDNNLTTNEDSVERRLDSTDAKIDGVLREIQNLKNHFIKDGLRPMCQEILSKVQETPDSPFVKHLTDAEKLLTKYELKLSEYNVTKGTPTDIVALSEVALADEAWHNKMTEVMERQGQEISKVQRLLSDAEGLWKDLPRVRDLKLATNVTLEAIVNATEQVREIEEKAVDKLSVKLREMGDRLESTNNDIQASLTQGNTLTERTFGELSRNYASMRSELQTLPKTEKVLLQTADNVLANKKRIDYGVQQILMQLTELVLRHGKMLNGTFNEGLDKIGSTMLDSQALTLVNLSTKMETEISQVWRQIGIMHEQLSSNKVALDKLNEISEQYVNSTSKSIGKLENNVASISTKMVKLGDDFNFALGNLALATQEFKWIASSISKTINGLKNEPTPKPDVGPGPYMLASNELTSS